LIGLVEDSIELVEEKNSEVRIALRKETKRKERGKGSAYLLEESRHVQRRRMELDVLDVGLM
jgi:hypothetical protein